MANTEKIIHPRLKYVDHGEGYGRHILEQWCASLSISKALDIGCGHGADLCIVGKAHPKASLCGVEYSEWNHAGLKAMGIEPMVCNIEAAPLPVADESVDLVLANQVFEHTKEIFWINHEIFRVLKVGGHLYLGVPNLLSLHNRILSLLGRHPTCIQNWSAHVRGFSKRDTYELYRRILPQACEIKKFAGAQFYPFPPSIARPLANAWPSAAVSAFFLIEKTAPYQGQIMRWLGSQGLETNFYQGV